MFIGRMKMERISVNIVSTWEHCSQIVTGFCMLEKNSGGGV